MKIYIALPFLLLILLVGCQSQTVSTEQLHADSEIIYLIFKNLTPEKNYLNEDERNEVDKFQSTYIKNSKDYPSDKELISEMEGLINSYYFYKASVGFKNENGKQMYKQGFEESISKLDKEFNN